MISIHTTTQVVTSGNLLHFPILCNFNPHHHAGGDHCLNHWHFCNTDFNPHHHAGGDQYLAGLGYNHQNFNPHHHAGGDKTIAPAAASKKISIHTTTQVVTRYCIAGLTEWLYFNPHHHAGGDRGYRCIHHLSGISIHTTTQVVTFVDSFMLFFLLISIHTTTQVVTANLHNYSYLYPSIFI